MAKSWIWFCFQEANLLQIHPVPDPKHCFEDKDITEIIVLKAIMNNTVIKAILDTTDILVIEVIMDTREIKDITFVKIENVTVVKDQVL